MRFPFIILFLPFFMIGHSLFSQVLARFNFEHFDVQEGLAAPFVYCTLEDQDGFMWVGTIKGLQRHDGNVFSQPFPQGKTKEILSNGIIKCLLEDRQGRIWVGTQGQGLVCLDKNKDTSRLFRKESPVAHRLTHNEILSLTEDSEGRIWIGTEDGLNVYLPKEDQMQSLSAHPGKPGALQAPAVLSILIDPSRNLWIGTWDGGLHRASLPNAPFSLQNLHFTTYQHDPSQPGSIPGNRVWSLHLDDEQRLWMAIYQAGVAMTIADSSQDRNFMVVKDEQVHGQGITDNAVFDVYVDEKDRLWVGSTYGITVSTPLPKGHDRITLEKWKSEQWNHLYRDNGLGGLRSNKIRQFNTDSSGNLWIATQDGITVFFPKGNLFDNHALRSDTDYFGEVTDLVESPHNTLWIGTTAGLFEYDPVARNILTRLLPEIFVSALHIDEQDRLWIGNDRGIELWSGDRLQTVLAQPGMSAQCIRTGPDERLWIASRDGLAVMDKVSGAAPTWLDQREGLTDPRMYNLLWDQHLTCWVATESMGLLEVRLHPSGWDWKQHLLYPDDVRSLNNKNFRTLALLDEQLWVGSTQGLKIFHIGTRKFESIPQAQELPSLEITSLVRSLDGSMWVQSSPKIAQWEPSTKTFIVWGQSQGLANLHYHPNTMIQLRNGKWVVGGENGISILNPENLPPYDAAPKVMITALTLFNQTVLPNQIPPHGTNPILSQPINLTDRIELNYQQQVFSLSFSTMQYRRDNLRLMQYRLEGIEKEWNQVSARREAIYTNLDAGTYTFQVRAANERGEWGEITELIIVVHPPIWLTVWFRVLVLLVTIGLIVGSIYWHTSRAQERENQLKQEVQQRTCELELSTIREREARLQAEEAGQVKANFLSTMSHEIRTPLNAVIGTTHILLQDDPRPDQEDSLHMLQFSAKNLLSLINDILDFSKIEAGKLDLEHIPFNFRQLIRDVCHTLHVKADEQGINLDWSFEKGMQEWYLGDQTRLSQILLNLIGNAIKFTKVGSVTVRAIPSGDAIRVEVSDTGIGIPIDRQEAIFEEFSQSNSSITRQFGGTGLGLAITSKLLHLMNSHVQLRSEPGVGSTFFFDLHLSKASTSEIEQPYGLSWQLPTTLDGVRILVAEDNLVNQRVIQKIMARWGVICQVVPDGKSAVDVATKEPFDLILMDLHMPIMDGIQATHELLGRGIRIPVIGLSAATLPEEVTNMRKAGMIDVIPKPFDPNTLQEKLSAALSLRLTK